MICIWRPIILFFQGRLLFWCGDGAERRDETWNSNNSHCIQVLFSEITNLKFHLITFIFQSLLDFFCLVLILPFVFYMTFICTLPETFSAAAIFHYFAITGFCRAPQTTVPTFASLVTVVLTDFTAGYSMSCMYYVFIDMKRWPSDPAHPLLFMLLHLFRILLKLNQCCLASLVTCSEHPQLSSVLDVQFLWRKSEERWHTL